MVRGPARGLSPSASPCGWSVPSTLCTGCHSPDSTWGPPKDGVTPVLYHRLLCTSARTKGAFCCHRPLVGSPRLQCLPTRRGISFGPAHLIADLRRSPPDAPSPPALRVRLPASDEPSRRGSHPAPVCPGQHGAVTSLPTGWRSIFNPLGLALFLISSRQRRLGEAHVHESVGQFSPGVGGRKRRVGSVPRDTVQRLKSAGDRVILPECPSGALRGDVAQGANQGNRPFLRLFRNRHLKRGRIPPCPSSRGAAY